MVVVLAVMVVLVLVGLICIASSDEIKDSDDDR